MTVEQIDAVRQAQPFRSFTLHLADGTKHPVSHPEMIWRTPGGRTIVVALGGEKTAIIDLLLVTKIVQGNGTHRRRSAG
jgi:hypothetical protein